MNFLFHMLLSGDDDQLLLGNFMGDFVKGSLQDRFAPQVRKGVLLHRRIDSYAEQHPLFRQSRHRLAAEYGLYRGVMVDLFYDYFLVNSWQEWSAEPFDCFLDRTRGVVEGNRATLPQEMQPLVTVIFEELLPSYASIAGIGQAFCRMSRRLSRPNPLNGCEVELSRHHEALQADFCAFTPDLCRFAAEQRQAAGAVRT
ncbi:MAG: ACP phosphodiesterase [Trichlorobacter sp.]|jgi:acyl carrier protein phosphodiesterase